MGKSLIKDQDGIAMIFVIMTMLVVSLLSVAALGMSTSNVKNSLTEREFQTSYYIAEAGANLYTEHIKEQCKKVYEESSDSDGFFTKLENDNTNALVYTVVFEGHPEGYIPKAESRLLLPAVSSSTDSRTYSIVSRGTSNHATRVVKKLITIEWTQGYELNSFHGVYARGNMIIDNDGLINSDLAAEGGITITKTAYIGDYYTMDGNLSAPGMDWWKNDPKYLGEGHVLTPVEYAMPAFPEIPDFDEKIDLPAISNSNEHKTIILNKDKTYIPTISVEGSCRLTIVVGDKDRELIVDNFNISQGYISIEGTGKLKLYVKENIVIGGSSIINHPNPPDFSTASKDTIETNATNATKDQREAAADKLSIYYKGSDSGTPKEFILAGKQSLNGSVFAEDAIVTIDGSGGMVGSLVTGGTSVRIGGGSGVSSNLIYAPEADVEVHGSGKVAGPIVSNNFTFKAGNNIDLDYALYFNPDDGVSGDTYGLVGSGGVDITEGVAREQ